MFIVLAVVKDIFSQKKIMSNSSATIPSKNHYRFYKIYVHFERGGDYSVYYRTSFAPPLEEVPWHAVWDGDLLECFMQNVDYVSEITSDEYHEHMWE